MRASNRHVMLEILTGICELNGSLFEASAEIVLAAGGNSRTLFITGSKPVVLLGREVSYDGIGFNAFIYRDPTYTIGTTFGDINNPNDICPQDTTVAINTDGTITDVGVVSRAPMYVFGSSSNQSQGSTLQVIGTPQWVAPNSTLLLEFVNRSSNEIQNVASHLRWLEPDNIPGLDVENRIYQGVKL